MTTQEHIVGTMIIFALIVLSGILLPFVFENFFSAFGLKGKNALGSPVSQVIPPNSTRLTVEDIEDIKEILRKRRQAQTGPTEFKKVDGLYDLSTPYPKIKIADEKEKETTHAYDYGYGANF